LLAFCEYATRGHVQFHTHPKKDEGMI